MLPTTPVTPTTPIMCTTPIMPTIHYTSADSPLSVSPRRSRTFKHSNINTKRSHPPQLHLYHAHRKTGAFTPRPTHPHRLHNVSGTHSHRRHNVSGTHPHRHHNVSGSRHLGDAPTIHTHIRPRKRHQSFIKPFARAPRTPPSSPMLPKSFMPGPPQRPWTPMALDDGSSVRTRSRLRDSTSQAYGQRAKESNRRTLRHAVRSLFSNIMQRRQRDDASGIEEVEEDEPPLTGLTTGAPLRPHRSPGAESFLATSGRMALEPSRSTSPPARASIITEDYSPVRPHLIIRPRTRRLPDRLVSRFSDSSADTDTDDGHSVFSFNLSKHAKQSFHPLLRGRKWSSAPSLSRGPLRAVSPTFERRGRSLDL